MIAATLLLLATVEQDSQAQAKPPTAVKLISGMLAHYSGLRSLKGTIMLKVDATAPTGSASESIGTDIQFEKPSKLYVHQVRNGKTPGHWLITSDGEHFSYNIPDDVPQGRSRRLIEAVKGQTISQLYGDCVRSIGDRSVPLGIATCWSFELKRIVAEWPVCRLIGEVDWNGAKVWKIAGKFKESPDGAVVGDFLMLVDKDGNLVQYQTERAFATPIDDTHSDAKHPTILKQTWTVDLQPNVTPDSALFQVVEHE